jgi:hypothetical protein
MIWSAASVMAWLAEAQARLTVKLCTPRGSCGSSEISRAMFGSVTFWITVPYTTACTSFGSRSVRASSSLTTWRPSSVAERRREGGAGARERGAQAGDDGDAAPGLAVGDALVEVRVGHAAG